MESGRKATSLSAASTLRILDSTSILPCSWHDWPATSDSLHVQWYDWWVRHQVQRQPMELFSTLLSYSPKSNEHWTNSVAILGQEISRYMTANESVSIDELSVHLLECNILHSPDNPEALIATKNLVFAIIGWQTMLYRPDMHSCPPMQLAIENDMGTHQGQAYMCLKQSLSVCKKRIHEFLLGFGVLLPPRNFNAPQSSEDKTVFNEIKTAAASSFNAHLLTSIAGINIAWVDSLACHLEFDPHSNTLFLFRYPSFCAANILSGKSSSPRKSVIHACAAPYVGTRQWATMDEVTQMLHETILSYRLLFGQKKAARKLFRKLSPFEGVPEEGRDKFLTMICGRKHYQATVMVPERESYDLSCDFPILRSKLAVLCRHLENKKPRTWKALWQDKRDSASWLTFWAVLIIGGLGIILAFLQVVLQIVQIAQQA